MRNIRLISRLDIKSKNLIKGIRLEGLRVLGKPYDFAKNYFDNGIDEIIYMDSVASLYNRNTLTDIIEETSKNIFIPITVGGGIRSIDDAYSVLKSGADKIAINTAAVRNPKLIEDLSNRFGKSTIVVSIEAKKNVNSWEAYTDNGRESTGLDVKKWALQCETAGAGEILLTSVDQDGTGLGFDCELVSEITNITKIPVIASGGMGTLDDFKKIISYSNCEAVAIGNVLHYKKITIPEIKFFATGNNINIRSS